MLNYMYLLAQWTWNIGKAPKQINISTWNLGMYLSGVSSFCHHWWRGLRQLDQRTQLGIYSRWLFSCYSIHHTIDEYSMHTTLNIIYSFSSLDFPPFGYPLCPIFFSFPAVLRLSMKGKVNESPSNWFDHFISVLTREIFYLLTKQCLAFAVFLDVVICSHCWECLPRECIKSFVITDLIFHISSFVQCLFCFRMLGWLRVFFNWL
jgi:hypothetical protein